MSSQTSPLLVLQPRGGTRSRLIRRAKLLSWLSIGWMTVEAGVAIVAWFGSDGGWLVCNPGPEMLRPGGVLVPGSAAGRH